MQKQPPEVFFKKVVICTIPKRWLLSQQIMISHFISSTSISLLRNLQNDSFHKKEIKINYILKGLNRKKKIFSRIDLDLLFILWDYDEL